MKNRIWEEFRDLVAIDSISFGEREMADVLTKKLTKLGFEVSEDTVGAQYGGNAGNLYGFLKGDLKGEPLLLSAHMDTVTPGIGKKAILHEDGTITSTKDTVLGGDDLTGIVGILEGIRMVQEAGKPHRNVEILFPIAEELYCKGTNVMDYSLIQAKEAYVLDMSGTPGTAALQAPTILSFMVTVRGKAAHAGFCPEQGVHAIGLMCEAVSKVKQGRLDEETTLNIGTISGGEATNIVPEQCSCKGEIRSYDHEKALESVEEIRKVFEQVLEGTGAEFTIDTEVNVHAYKTGKDSRVVKRFEQACENLGLKSHFTSTFGGSDNNNFVLHGIEGIVLSCGMNQVHSVEEYTTIKDLELCAKMVAELITI
jgi:tripeptide aminopeptidase